MKEVLFRTFARLLAVLGCSTLVTACYGVPYDAYEAKVSDRVSVDGEVNGSYLPKSKEYAWEEAENADIRLERNEN